MNGAGTQAELEPEYAFESNQHRVCIQEALRTDELTQGDSEG